MEPRAPVAKRVDYAVELASLAGAELGAVEIGDAAECARKIDHGQRKERLAPPEGRQGGFETGSSIRRASNLGSPMVARVARAEAG